MADFEKIVKLTDAVLDCIPYVSTLSNVSQALYKLAHKVDAQNPANPGLKTSIKIHALSKDNLRCFMGAVPFYGNALNLFFLVSWAVESVIYGFNFNSNSEFLGGDDLEKAVEKNNSEVVRLGLESDMLTDPERAHRILEQAAHSSNNEIFNQILNGREEWSSKSLMNALKSFKKENFDNSANMESLLNYWDAKQKVLVIEDIYFGMKSLESFIKNGQVDRAEKIITILPKGIKFQFIFDFLFFYSCGQPKYLSGKSNEKVVLSEKTMNTLLGKCEKPTFEQLQSYFKLMSGRLGNPANSEKMEADRKAHFSIVKKLFELADLQPEEIANFISSPLRSEEFSSNMPFNFIADLIFLYGEKLTSEGKMEILKKLPPCNNLKTDHAKRFSLFNAYLDKWKNGLTNEQAIKLDEEIFSNAKKDIELIEERFRISPNLADHYPSIQERKGDHNEFKNDLRVKFPSCNWTDQ